MTIETYAAELSKALGERFKGEHMADATIGAILGFARALDQEHLEHHGKKAPFYVTGVVVDERGRYVLKTKNREPSPVSISFTIDG